MEPRREADDSATGSESGFIVVRTVRFNREEQLQDAISTAEIENEADQVNLSDFLAAIESKGGALNTTRLAFRWHDAREPSFATEATVRAISQLRTNSFSHNFDSGVVNRVKSTPLQTISMELRGLSSHECAVLLYLIILHSNHYLRSFDEMKIQK